MLKPITKEEAVRLLSSEEKEIRNRVYFEQDGDYLKATSFRWSFDDAGKRPQIRNVTFYFKNAEDE